MKSDKASFMKTIAVIDSCKTKEQLDVAERYVELACNFGDTNYFYYYPRLEKRLFEICDVD